MFERFNDTIQNTTYATNDLDCGLKLLRKSSALKKDYIGLNRKYMSYLVFDIDYEFSYLDADWLGLPVPTITINNPENGHAHILYELETPIVNTDKARMKPLKYFAHVERCFRHQARADKSYAGVVVKNPGSSRWRTTVINKIYDLQELADYINEVPPMPKPFEINGVGRNCELFDKVRHIAYRAVKTIDKCSALYDLCLQELIVLNSAYNVPLLCNELKHIAKSISNWTWKNRHTIGSGRVPLLAGEYDEWEQFTTQQKQALGAIHTNSVRTQATIKKVKYVVNAMRLNGEKVTQEKVANILGVNILTVKKYWCML